MTCLGIRNHALEEGNKRKDGNESEDRKRKIKEKDKRLLLVFRT